LKRFISQTGDSLFFCKRRLQAVFAGSLTAEHIKKKVSLVELIAKRRRLLLSRKILLVVEFSLTEAPNATVKLGFLNKRCSVTEYYSQLQLSSGVSTLS